MVAGSVGTMDLTPLIQSADTKILLVVMDGLGGYADADHGTELEEANTPNLDQLASAGASGLFDPVGPGITPGSGPGHLGLFGYDPTEFELGRGALSAAGLEVVVAPGDVAARGNLCTLDKKGIITDRRAGRIADDQAQAIVEKLQSGLHIEGIEILVRHEREHRCLVVLRGPGLDPRVGDTDPQKIGLAPLKAVAQAPEAARTAEIINNISEQVATQLKNEAPANGLLLRGFDTHRELPSMQERYGVRAAAIATYPMYRGISHLLGMDVIGQPTTLDDQMKILRDAWDDYDYFFFHYKGTDSAGEDGDRARKIAAIEALDAVVPAFNKLGPDVIAVSGDHSTPSQMAAHSWHPVPTLLWSERVGRDEVTQYGERYALRGSLGMRPLKDLMALMLANAGRLQKYGA